MQLESLDSLDLARHVRPGDGVIFQQGCGEARAVIGGVGHCVLLPGPGTRRAP